MSVLEKIKELFDVSNVAYDVIEHAPVYTSADAAKIRDTSMAMGAKALVLVADKNPVLVVVPGDKRLDFKKFKHNFNVKDLRMASPEEILELTSLEIGSIPPVGKAMNLNSYYDISFNCKDEVAFNAGSHTVSIKMKSEDLIKVEQPRLAVLT